MNETTQQAAQQIATLLAAELKTEKCRKIWAQYLPANIPDDTSVISYRAVARALAHTEHARYGTSSQPNRYKDRVRRALLGQSITVETLHLFADCFGMDSSTVRTMAELLTSGTETPVYSSTTTNLRYSITTSFYDIYIDRNLKPRKLICSLVLRSLQPELDGVWAPQSPDISDIELLQGGSDTFDATRNMWHFLFDYPLAEMESTELVYAITVDQSAEQVGLASLRYYLERENCFFRLHFECEESAPDQLKVIRRPVAEDTGECREQTFLLDVHHGRASFHLPLVRNEQIIFEIAP